MNIPVQISFCDVESSDAVQAAIRKEIADLQRYFSGIVSCRVVVSEPHRHRQKGRLYQVRICLAVPGDEVVVSHEHPHHPGHADVYQAIRSSFHVARRELEEFVRRMRREVKTHIARPQPA